MSAHDNKDIVVTGLGVTTAIGQGAAEFAIALFTGTSKVAPMHREGRQEPDGTSNFFGSEISDAPLLKDLPTSIPRKASLSAQVAVATLQEAWQAARLNDVDPTRIGLVIGGSNVQQRQLIGYQSTSAPEYISPSYAFAYMDTDIVGICTEYFNIRGPAFTVGAASASGQAAVIQAACTVLTDQADVCIALGAMADLSHWECRAFQSIGAMATPRPNDPPETVNRPFDRDAQGFVFGESCAAVVVERQNRIQRRGTAAQALLTGWSMVSAANRSPQPSYAGEVQAIRKALAMAGIAPGDIEYVNPHGTGSPAGDRAEADALIECGLADAAVNCTKSLTGHGLSSAGIVELAATLLQMRHKRLHPSRNLTHPITERINWVVESRSCDAMRRAINLSHGFAGINTALCLEYLH